MSNRFLDYGLGSGGVSVSGLGAGAVGWAGEGVTVTPGGSDALSASIGSVDAAGVAGAGGGSISSGAFALRVAILLLAVSAKLLSGKSVFTLV